MLGCSSSYSIRCGPLRWELHPRCIHRRTAHRTPFHTHLCQRPRGLGVCACRNLGNIVRYVGWYVQIVVDIFGFASRTHGFLTDVTYLHHPIYVLTGCALILGIVESIVYKKKTDAAIKATYAPDAATKRRRGMKCECEKLRTKAFKATQPVEQDIRELLGIAEASTSLFPKSKRSHRAMQPYWTKCMDWLKAMEL